MAKNREYKLRDVAPGSGGHPIGTQNTAGEPLEDEDTQPGDSFDNGHTPVPGPPLADLETEGPRTLTVDKARDEPFKGFEATVPIGADFTPAETFERIRGSFSNAKEADIHINAFQKVCEVLRALVVKVPDNFQHFEAMSVEFVSCLVDKGLILVSEDVFNQHVNDELQVRWTKKLEESGFTPEEPGDITAAQVEEAMREFVGPADENLEEHVVCMCVLPDNDVAKRDQPGPHHVAECPLYDADAAEYE